jgi:hypothetical protein
MFIKITFGTSNSEIRPIKKVQKVMSIDVADRINVLR